MDYQKLLNELNLAGDKKYKDFNERLIPGVQKTYGIRVPWLRAKAKELALQWEDFLAVARDDSQEEVILQGLVIGYARCPLDARLKYLSAFIPKINNWAICDIVCSNLKVVKKDLPLYYSFLQPYMQSDLEFSLRFAIVSLMDYYIIDEYIEEVLDFLTSIEHPAYYVQMAVAWALSVCFVKYRDLTLACFYERQIKNDGINNRAIQKIRESYRVSQSDKEILLTYKR